MYILLKTLWARALTLTAIALAFVVAGCDAPRSEDERIDVAWHTSNALVFAARGVTASDHKRQCDGGER